MMLFLDPGEQSLVEHPYDLKRSESLHAIGKGVWVLCVHGGKGKAMMLEAEGCASSSEHCRVTSSSMEGAPQAGFVQEAESLQSC